MRSEKRSRGWAARNSRPSCVAVGVVDWARVGLGKSASSCGTSREGKKVNRDPRGGRSHRFGSFWSVSVAAWLLGCSAHSRAARFEPTPHPCPFFGAVLVRAAKVIFACSADCSMAAGKSQGN